MLAPAALSGQSQTVGHDLSLTIGVGLPIQRAPRIRQGASAETPDLSFGRGPDEPQRWDVPWANSGGRRRGDGLTAYARLRRSVGSRGEAPVKSTDSYTGSLFRSYWDSGIALAAAYGHAVVECGPLRVVQLGGAEEVVDLAGHVERVRQFRGRTVLTVGRGALGHEAGDGGPDGAAADAVLTGEGGGGASLKIGGAYGGGLVGRDGRAAPALAALGLGGPQPVVGEVETSPWTAVRRCAGGGR